MLEYVVYDKGVMNYQPPQREPFFEIRRLILRWLISSLAIFVAVWLVPGITFTGPGWQLGVVAIILGLLNAFLRPLLLLFALPLIFLTLGLFALVVNALMLTLASALADQIGIAFHVNTFWSALLGGLVISLVSGLLNLLVGGPNVKFYIHRGGEQE
jgi:putative membrane protein